MKVLPAFPELFQCPKTILMLCCLTIGSCYLLKPPINSFNTSSFDLTFQSTNKNTLSFGDTLFLIKNDKSKPHYFFQRFSTGVCFDNKCRPLDITLYWNTTGRYLGFEMPEGEFLSKTDHDPFSKKEYLQLNEILCNTELPFKNIQYHELINQPENTAESVDGIPKVFLNDSNFQETLFSSYLKTTDASTKNALVKKLKSAPQLSKKLLVKSRQKIQSLAPQEISCLLQLYKKQQFNESATLETIRALKNHHNAYVVNLAIDFLKGPEEKANE